MRIIVASILGLALTTMAISATVPASRPASRPASSPARDLSSPAKTLLTLADAMEAADRDAIRALMDAPAGPASDFADDFALMMATNRRFHLAVQKKFPDNKESTIWDFASDKGLAQTRETVGTMEFTIEGNTASAKPGGPMKQFVKNGDAWRLDLNVPQVLQYPIGDVDVSMIYLLARYTPAIDSIIDDINADKLTTIADIKKAIETRSSPIQEKVNRDLASIKAQRAATQTK